MDFVDSLAGAVHWRDDEVLVERVVVNLAAVLVLKGKKAVYEIHEIVVAFSIVLLEVDHCGVGESVDLVFERASHLCAERSCEGARHECWDLDFLLPELLCTDQQHSLNGISDTRLVLRSPAPNDVPLVEQK